MKSMGAFIRGKDRVILAIGIILLVLFGGLDSIQVLPALWKTILWGVSISILGIGFFVYARKESDGDLKRMGWVVLVLSIAAGVLHLRHLVF